ncbi:uncharacterized protein LOC143367986 [Andrena cerasifolii]|uniref:uncharacterized protein LOC143367986 n=1 Tax=Andrena cerasifolii TaxID=2819439 RepID=UPI004037E6BE
MSPPERKTRGWTGKEGIINARYLHRQHRKRPVLPRRVQAHSPINVPELVYRLLNGDEHNQVGPIYGTGLKPASIRTFLLRIGCTTPTTLGGIDVPSGGRGSRGTAEFREKMRKYQNHREPSYDTASLRETSVSIDGSGCTQSVTTSMENMSRVLEATNSSGSENSSVSNVSVEPITLANSIDNTRALLKKKSLVQIINNYIKAGIEEGKRQAKKYIRKALSFGVKSGYLIPADPQGQLIRVSPTLAETSRSNAESRKKRRRARKGEDEDPFDGRKERRRGTPPLATKRKPRREVTPEPVVPRKRRKTSASRKPRADSNATERIDRKKSAVHRGRKAGTKKANTATTKEKGKVMHCKVSALPKKSEEQVGRRKREEVRGRSPRNRRGKEAVQRKENLKDRTTKSPFVRKVGKDNGGMNPRDSSDEDSAQSNKNEVNQGAEVERRKSTSRGREVLPGEDNEWPRNSAREVQENLEPPSIEEMNDNNVVPNSI